MGMATPIQRHRKLGFGLSILQVSSFSFIPPIMTISGACEGPEIVTATPEARGIKRIAKSSAIET